MKEHLIVGSLFAAFIVFIFLRRFRPTLIAAIAIPSSLIATFAAMQYMGFTLNVITLLALTLAVGIVIDDAVVVLENVFRFMEEKKLTPREAAIQGTREVGLAVLATSLSLIAVFLPVAFMGGIVGRFMYSFGVTMAFAIAVSLLVAFSLTPMLASRWLKAKDVAEPGPGLAAEGFLRRVERGYLRLLDFAMAHRWMVVVTMVLVFVSIVPLFMAVNKNFLPNDDESQFQVIVRAARGGEPRRHADDPANRSPARCASSPAWPRPWSPSATTRSRRSTWARSTSSSPIPRSARRTSSRSCSGCATRSCRSTRR